MGELMSCNSVHLCVSLEYIINHLDKTSSVSTLPDHSSATEILQITNKMKLLKFLLPLLLVASVSSFSLKSLFSHEGKAEEVPAEETAVEDVDEEASEEEEDEEEDEEFDSLEEDEEEDELEEEEEADSVALEEDEE